MSGENVAKWSDFMGILMKGMWVVIAYFAVDIHVRVKNIEEGLNETDLDYAQHKAVTLYRLKSIEDYNNRRDHAIRYENPDTDNDSQ